MDSIQTNSRKQDNHILKSNLWKFFKTLRAQANPIYCLLVASPISYARITIFDKSDSAVQKRISIAQFINSLKKMPSTGKYYRLSLNTYNIEKGNKQIFEASLLHELSFDVAAQLLPAIIAYHCVEAQGRGERFEMNDSIRKQYKFKEKYIYELQLIMEQCNNAIDEKSE
ncbi:MAG: hypothetical protein E7137_08100 [Rikenellaceae bacterium]|nr:hypothetical protein [Rikenellaceae bacterium]